ncbi:MAG: glycosyl hydrolase family 28-related protein [Candidatus Hydrogenedentes bacterium]|nr:glycosyl hydrolase family 28-related protein [Candidatus Hydrogenedentota bacterium]
MANGASGAGADIDVTKAPYNAKADGVTDDTASFQRALFDAGQDERGGTVFAPRGNYLIAGNLRFPPNVTLEGVWEFVPTSYQFWYPEKAKKKIPGTVLLATGNEGQIEGPPFISLHVNCCIKGVTIYYPNQVKANPPKPYPWTIAVTEGGADHCTIRDVLLVNPYQAVDFGTYSACRHFIENLYAYPLFKGLYVDKCYDIGRIENIHFWPFWGYTGDDDPVGRFVSENAEAFIFGRTDWEYVTNCFAIFYKVGFHFIKTPTGSPNVLVTQSGSDISPNAIVVEDCQSHAGLSFLNSQLFGRVNIRETNTGMVRFTGCGFFGATREAPPVEPIHVDVKGSGHISFDNCHFITLDPKNTATTNIRVSGGSLSVANSLFKDIGRTHVAIESGARSAIVSGNTFDGVAKIVNHGNANVQIALNADRTPPVELGATIIDDAASDGTFATDGTWFIAQGGDNYADGTHWAMKGEGESKATFRPNLPKSGKYAVFLWHGGDPQNDHATDRPVAIRDSGGTKEIRLDLKKDAGQWVPLGTFAFKKGKAGNVLVNNRANGNILADAVKWVRE